MSWWPWISRSVHEETVRDLKTRLDEAEQERRKTQDDLLRMMLGVHPYQQAPAALAAEETTEITAEDEQEQWLEYLRTNKPSQYKQALANALARRPMGPQFKPAPKPARTPEAKAATAAAFDNAEAEVRQTLNGNDSAA